MMAHLKTECSNNKTNSLNEKDRLQFLEVNNEDDIKVVYFIKMEATECNYK